MGSDKLVPGASAAVSKSDPIFGNDTNGDWREVYGLAPAARSVAEVSDALGRRINRRSIA